MRSAIKQVKNRVLQLVAFHVPGAKTLRVRLHQWRGVKIGQNVWIGYQVLLETSRPHLITIGDNVIISIRAMMIAHFRGPQGIRIEDDAFIGPGAIILPNVTIGRGAVVTAGSVVSSSVPPMTVVQGNPARPIATCSVTLGEKTDMGQFLHSLRPVVQRRASIDSEPDSKVVGSVGSTAMVSGK
jgi:NDP-sugar pyrophosphorylase family protein